MIEWSFDGTTIRCQAAGGPMASIAAGNIGSLADPLRLGRGASSGLTLDGSVASALIVNRYLNASERLAARSNLSSRYGVPSSEHVELRTHPRGHAFAVTLDSSDAEDLDDTWFEPAPR